MISKKQILLFIIILVQCFTMCSISFSQPARLISSGGPAHPSGVDTSCGVVWLPPGKISPEGTQGYTPRMTAQGDTVHLIYEVSNKHRLPYIRSTNSGIDWEPIKELITDTIRFPYWNVQNLKMTSNRKKMYIFFIGGSNAGGETPIYMLSSSDRGDSWTQPVAIIPTAAFPRNVAIFGDTLSIMALVYSTASNRNIFTTNGGANWTISSGPIMSADPRVAITRNWTHLFYYIYVNGFSAEIIYKRSSDFGMTWGDSSIISTPDYWASMGPYPFVTPNNDLFVMWRDAKYGGTVFGGSGIVRQSTDEGKEWLSETVATDTPKSYGHTMHINGNTVAAAWDTDDPNMNVETNISYDYGRNWCRVFEVTPRGSYTSGFITLAANVVLTNSTIIVAYEQCDSLGALFQIWSRIGLLPTSSVRDEPDLLPKDYRVLPAYPNPFNGSTRIRYSIPKSSDVKLTIYNILGEKVFTLVDEYQTTGWQEAVWEAGNSPSGIYFYRLQVGKYNTIKKMLLVK